MCVILPMTQHLLHAEGDTVRGSNNVLSDVKEREDNEVNFR